MNTLLKFPNALHLMKVEPDTTRGSAMREALWSLYNPAYPAQLWAILTDLSLTLRSELVQLVLMPDGEREAVLRELLEAGGEMERIDRMPTRGQALWVRREGETLPWEAADTLARQMNWPA